ncbi:uncharacterized protein LTR77_010196 [Saxophila tyrrhenica]|uniref:Uncharacterized protein n=1 Tax=Saxophila tyrrhenica TaxID=1690608 RepID=A0AAV9NWQ7_9PEZI|nr:hypothetical protein LTR77_010196 [Saxophila tyrrhenica]
MLRCLGSRLCGTHFPAWGDTGNPHQAFALGSWPYYALLGLESCQDIVLVLIQGKLELGHKIVKSITIFQPTPQPSGKGYYDMSDWPALLLEIDDYKEEYIVESDKGGITYDETGLNRPPLMNSWWESLNTTPPNAS